MPTNVPPPPAPCALVVDDDPAILDEVSERLEAIGHRCQVVGSVEDARASLAQGGWNYLVLDLEYPMTIDWNAKGATLSDATAEKEFGIPRADLHRAIQAGRLHYQVASMHGNPWFRLLRTEVEAMAKERLGADGLQQRALQTQLAKAQREIRSLQKRQTALKKQCEEWQEQLEKLAADRGATRQGRRQ